MRLHDSQSLYGREGIVVMYCHSMINPCRRGQFSNDVLCVKTKITILLTIPMANNNDNCHVILQLANHHNHVPMT